MYDPRTVEPLEHRRLRLHAYSAGLGLFGGLAATFGGFYHWGIVIGPIAGFLAAPLITRWLIHKQLAAVLPAAFAASIILSLGAGFLPNPLIALAAAATGTLIATRLLTTNLPDTWPPDPDRCTRCAYDLRGAPGPICPECGLDATEINCLNCGYSLHGLPEPTCPECGHEQPPTRPSDSGSSAQVLTDNPPSPTRP